MALMAPKTRRYLFKILPFGVIWLIFALIYVFIEQGILGDATVYPSTGNPYSFGSALWVTSSLSLVVGLGIGAVEILLLNKLFQRRKLGVKIMMKTAIYVLVLIGFLWMGASFNNSIRLEAPLFGEEVWGTVLVFFKSFAFWGILIYIGAIFIITLFVSDVTDNLGQGILHNFLFGKYHRPREENRVFMFMDMRSSTTIAEKLGHVKYFELLRKCYADMTEAIIDSEGEIYQYVGDEVVVSWQLDKGLSGVNCLDSFYRMKEAIRENVEYYRETFNLVPEFKAGLHFGGVTIGELGVVKKDIVFTGDVLNTTARIQGLCNSYGVDILLSAEMAALLDSHHYNFSEIGEVELRGRDQTIVLQTARPAG